jgi:Skp family chaperone for outer membrane proteins
VKRHSQVLFFSLGAALIASCAARSPIGLVDVQRIVNNWPEYQGYQNQLVSEERSIESRRESTARKQSAALALQRKYGKITDQLSQQIRDAAGKIAAQRQLKLVLTREGIGYGGIDITTDVEKALNITEKATPTPGT